MADEKLLNSLNAPMFEAMAKAGITTEYLMEKLNDELKASETRVFNGKDGLIYSNPLVAHDVRQRARIDAHRLLGHYPADQHHFTGSVSTVLPPEDVALLDEVKAILKGRARPKDETGGSL